MDASTFEPIRLRVSRELIGLRLDLASIPFS